MTLSTKKKVSSPELVSLFLFKIKLMIYARHAAEAWPKTVPSVGRHAQAKGIDDIFVVSL